MTAFEKKICDQKIVSLCSPMVIGIVTGWCIGLNEEQKEYILSNLLDALCAALRIKREKVIANEQATN